MLKAFSRKVSLIIFVIDDYDYVGLKESDDKGVCRWIDIEIAVGIELVKYVDDFSLGWFG
jgi:hypothetical protein